MEVPQGWKPLTGGHGKDLAITLDFEAIGRPEACFTDLVPMLDLPLETWAAAQPHFACGQQRSARSYLRHWSGSLRETGREVRAVLGYCAGAVYAAALADEIARWQPRLPAVVLLDPDPPTAATLIKQFENAVTALGAVAPAALGDGTGLSALGNELTSLYRDVSEPAFARIGLKPGYRHELVASFGSLMSYLAAAADIRPGPGWAAATAIVSATHPREPAGVARQVSVAADHAGLLRDAAVARLVSELLR